MDFEDADHEEEEDRHREYLKKSGSYMKYSQDTGANIMGSNMLLGNLFNGGGGNASNNVHL